MVKAIIDINEDEDRVLNFVKGKFSLRDKSEAVSLIINQYEQELLEPELRQEYIEKMKNREKEPTVRVKEFRTHFGLKWDV